jgi:hypothetical protein
LPKKRTSAFWAMDGDLGMSDNIARGAAARPT